ncbi:hypothetical protein P691DRAFT_61148 [Macrolepiota fuliginosa MF-IS2]|uniref:Uncharacterized protein n=1 Tax=Macrolepiota fuliginosa MF-IS2 TaxID=1400762 RepID=A0A9P5XPG7_9AGAR|nr:hypothetical protein P691DRAFT_61148 [Macrolepiota fuliginosa MF-IS2]
MANGRRKKHRNTGGPKHKANCRKSSEKTSTDDLVTVILFAVNEEEPELIRIPIQILPTEHDGPWCTNWPGQSPLRALKTMCSLWLPNKFPRGQCLHIIYNDSFLVNGSALNHCIQRITDGRAGYPWAGNIMAVRADCLGQHRFWDAKPEDVVALQCHFLYFRLIRFVYTPTPWHQRTWVRLFLLLGLLLFLYFAYRPTK